MNEEQEEQVYVFGVVGEVEITHVTEEEAEEEFMNMTMREALKRGLYLD